MRRLLNGELTAFTRSIEALEKSKQASEKRLAELKLALDREMQLRRQAEARLNSESARFVSQLGAKDADIQQLDAQLAEKTTALIHAEAHLSRLACGPSIAILLLLLTPPPNCTNSRLEREMKQALETRRQLDLSAAAAPSSPGPSSEDTRLRQQLEDVKHRLELEAQRTATLQQQLEEHKTLAQELRLHKDRLLREQAQQGDAAADLARQVKSLTSDLDVLRTTLVDERRAHQNLKSAHARLETQAAAAADTASALRASRDGLQDDLDALKAAHTSLANEVVSCGGWFSLLGRIVDCR